jgi:hypothetical protein
VESHSAEPASAERWSGVPDAVRDWMQEWLRRERPLMLLQVGSTARGYALPGSDYDFMAFFADEREHTSIDAEAAGIRLTVDGNSLSRFVESAADFRFDLASLRQLHKVRDGIHRIAPAAETDYLLRLAASAHLDRSVVLAQCVRIAQQAGDVTAWPVRAQHQQLIAWTELLGTLVAVSLPGAEAYSKPKWLHRTLAKTGASATLDLLRLLYAPEGADPRALLRGLEEHWARDFETVSPGYGRKMLAAALDDAREAVEHFPEWSFTQLRFTAGRLHRLSRHEEPVAVLAAGGRLPSHVAAAMRCGADLSLHSAWASFRELYASVARGAVDDARRAWTSRIGSRRFYTHVLGFYDATDLMPHAVEDRVLAMIATVEDFVAAG